MRNVIAKILAYAWPALVIAYILGFSYYFVEWMKTFDPAQADYKFNMAISMPVWLLGIVVIFVIQYFYIKLVKWIKK